MFIQTEADAQPGDARSSCRAARSCASGVVDFTDARGGASARRWRAACSRSTASTGVFLGADFITVTKARGQDW